MLLFLTPDPDDDEIEYDKTDAFSPFLTVDEPVPRNLYFPDDPLLSSILIEGDEELIKSLESPFNLIIGRDTIKKFNLVFAFPSHFFSQDTVREMQDTTHLLSPLPIPVDGSINGDEDNRSQTLHDTPRVECAVRPFGDHTDSERSSVNLVNNKGEVEKVDIVPRTQARWREGDQLDSSLGVTRPTLPDSTQTKGKLQASLVEEDTMLLFLTPDPDDDEIDYDKTDAFSPFLTVDEPVPRNLYFPDDPLLSSILLEGDEELIKSLVILITKFKHLFSNTLSSTPASIPPFNLVVDNEKWQNPKHRGPPRVQSPAKQAEIAKQIDQLLKQGIIERSNASYYSQIILTPKSDNTYRFCINYRAVNDCTQPASWPVPHIGQMLIQLGGQKSSIFGIVDLTQGYHQAPVSLATRVFTAFIAFCGIFHYLRLPFGPKRAPSYFQEVMAAIVLCGLIYFMCEIYLDDCIIHAADNETFISRLEQVLSRFDRHNIVLKPSKCKFGLPQVEF